jgi:hypothetical protein
MHSRFRRLAVRTEYRIVRLEFTASRAIHFSSSFSIQFRNQEFFSEPDLSRFQIDPNCLPLRNAERSRTFSYASVSTALMRKQAKRNGESP